MKKEEIDMSIDKLDLQSPDLVNENFEKLAALFPNCVTESADGKVIDFDLLKQELSHAVIEGNRERYRLEWPGKREAVVTANLPTTKTLRPIRQDSVDFDNTENLYIEGDNLEVLKILQESYFGKIKMIYIDPPYNTGNDFVYKDNFTGDKEEELFESGQIDEYNRRLVANPEASGRYHSDWLSMMYPRLKLARNLLTEDGVIFISIDDNEVHNLRKICDEVFGESNFVGELVWERAYAPKNDAKYISNSHDYVLMYTKSIENFQIGRLSRTEEANARYSNPDNDPRGVWKASDMSVKTYNSECDYQITTPSGRIIEPPTGRCWRLSKKAFLERLQDNRIWFGIEGNSVPSIKRFLTELKFDGMAPTSIMFYKDVGHSQEGAKEVTALLEAGAFDGPKPVRLLRRLLTLANTQQDSIILDFFSGSATTAHAVMQLNAEDGGSRKYIMVQLPETTDENSEAYKAGYKNICDIGKERIRRAANKIKEEKRAKAEKEGMFADFEDTQDYGFRVYRLADSNMQDVYYRPQDYKQETLDLFDDNIKPDRTPDDLLAQVMLDWGLPLSYKIEQATINGKLVFKVAQDSLFACFDKGIDEAFAKEIAKEKPMRLVFRDNGFASDTAKINVQQLLKQLSPETEMKVI
ncbi:MAG: site-specific DNA-methyltransferase [Massilibacteroides sp.]|nr:site-specific DNA-methyltransferase [Massilibacteroides sp.]MDD3062037.1 site-specific DNA-methyltransferase [Massilibacteroides sp.]